MTQPKFSFNLAGTTQAPTNLFGSSVTSTPAAAATQPSIFGQSTPAATQSFGFGGFGAASAIKPATANPFGTTAAAVTTSPFGQQPKPAGFSGFGQTAPVAQPAGFSGFGQTAPVAQPAGFSGFGQPATTAQPANNLFGSTATATAQPSIFASSAAQPQQQLLLQQQQQTSLLGANASLSQTAQVQPPTSLADNDILTQALTNATVFNDERDLILAKWNQLQAFYGHGKVFYQNNCLDITKDSRLSRFKSITYNCKPQYKNENGLVTLLINKTKEECTKNQAAICDTLHKTFSSDQSLSVKVESIKALEDPTKSEFVFYVEQRLSQMTEEKTRVAATLVSAHLKKTDAPAAGSAFLSLKTATNSTRQLLESMGVYDLYPLVGLTDEQIKKYLDTPPIGFNPVLWDLAKKNNPNPAKLLPAQINGFSEVSKRFKLQGQECEAQKRQLEGINAQIAKLNGRNMLIKTKVEQMKGRNEGVEQRILKVIINYEIRRKIGIPIQDSERYLLNILDSFQIELNSPINKEIQRQKFSQFTENIKTIENATRIKGKRQLEQQAANQINELNDLGDVQKSLKEQQKAFKSLIDIINTDLKDLHLIRTCL